MKFKSLKKFLAICFVICFSLYSLSACGNSNKDEGGKGDSLSDGTDGSAQNSQTSDELVGTDTSDANGEGNEVEGDDTEATLVTPTVISEAEIRQITENALGVQFDSIYNLQYQDEVENQLEIIKKKDTYNLDQPLFVLNPYGTNHLGMYVYLNTEEDALLEYTVSVDNQAVPDFTRHLYTKDAKVDSEHEGYILGLVPGVTNTITIRSFDGSDAITDKYVYQVDMPASNTIEQPVLDLTQEGSLEELSEGLFAVFETGKGKVDRAGHILFYDNAGVIRGEIPLDGTSANSRLEIVDENLLYACSDNQFALVNTNGKVEYIYAVPNYRLHHDFDYDDDEDCIIALASNESKSTQEDCVLLINLETGDFTELLDFTAVFPDIAKKAVNSATDPEEEGVGWIQLNGIQIMDSDNIIVSSRELNSIIKIDNVRENPKIAYIISDPSFWEGTPYTQYLLEQTGGFTNHAGQYSIAYLKDDSLEDGQYYIHMFNNNYGNSTSYEEFDYSAISNVGNLDQAADNSFYYQYLVDEDGKTYEIKDSFAVPYSNVLGSTQKVDGNTVVCSGAAGVFGEYDASGNLITEYKVTVPEEDYLYRVYKYRMDGYWFN